VAVRLKYIPMPDENLMKYIRDGLAMGRTEDILRSLLLQAGWAQKDIDDAFVVVHGGTVAVAQPIQPSVAQSTQSMQPLIASPSSSPVSRKKTWVVVALVALIVIIGGGWVAYAYLIPPSPQQVLDAMFQKGIEGINSMDTDTQVSIDVHLTPATSASSTAPSTLKSTPTASSYVGLFLGGMPSELSIQMESSGTVVNSPSGDHAMEQRVHFGFNAGESGQNMSFAIDGEGRVVSSTAYFNIKTLPNLGFIDLSPLEGKWIKIAADSSTVGMAQNLTGASSLSVPSTTFSAADVQKLSTAAEKLVTITKTLPNETIGGVSNYHYAYSINKDGIENMADTIMAIAKEQIKNISSTASIDASTTAAMHTQISSTLAAFTSMGGEIWIGKSDHYPHQVTLSLAFASSTPESGTVNGTLNVTSTITNINGGQIIEVPPGAEDIQTLFQSMFATPTMAPSAGGSASIKKK
jgi:hypothetical protein